jgi:histidinol-phosphate aminotransferase
MRMGNVSRRSFLGAAVGTLALPDIATAKGIRRIPGWRPYWAPTQSQVDEYDALAHLSSNENPFGPSQKTLDAMTYAFKYSMRYGYPDNNVMQRIAEDVGVDRQNLLLGAGSGESLEVVGLTYLGHGKKVVGVEPTYMSVYRTATGIDADVIALPLDADHRQDMDMFVDTVNRHYREIGLVYLCNPNNPTGSVVTADEVAYLLDNIPEDVPVLIDEAYHHFVDDPAYEESLKYVREGRRVVVTRTFSKLYGMAAMRIGYAIAPRDMIREMEPYSTGSVNVLARWGAVAALEDVEAQRMVLDHNRRMREQTVSDLASLGYESIPSETNFFFVNLGRPVAPVRRAFRERNVAVGRDFPPMLDHLRVSIGSEEEMSRFMNAFEDVMRTTATSSSG